MSSDTRKTAAPAPAVLAGSALGFVVICLAVYILYIARTVMVPFMVALFAWYLINAVARLLGRLKVAGRAPPRFLCFLLAIGALLGTMSGVIGLLSQNIGQMAQTAPLYQQKLQAVLPQVVSLLHLDHTPTVQELLAYIDIEGVLLALAGVFTGIAGKTAVVAFYVGFLLYEQRFFDRKLSAMFRDREAERRARAILREIDVKIQRYIGVKSLMSATDSFLTFVILSSTGVAFAEFWGIMAFFLHFIPYAGSMVAITMPALIALIQFPDLSSTVLVVTLLCLSHAFIGHVLDPYVMGNNLNLSPIFIITSLAMWGMIWGVPGMFLAIPILAMIVIALAQFPSTRPIAVMLSKTGDIGGAPRARGDRA